MQRPVSGLVTSGGLAALVFGPSCEARHLYRYSEQISSRKVCHLAGKEAMTNPPSSAGGGWFVYMLSTAGGALYTGISTDPPRRLREHAGSARGARSLRGKGPLQLVFQHPVSDRGAAGRLEARIKKLSRRDKLRLLRGELDPAALLPLATLAAIAPD